mgnify:CR=1 FL=1
MVPFNVVREIQAKISKLTNMLEDDNKYGKEFDALERAITKLNTDENVDAFKETWKQIINDSFSGPEWEFLKFSDAADPGADFLAKLETLKGKAEQLRDDGHSDAYNSAMAIYDKLNAAYRTLDKDGHKADFQTTCHDAINDNRSVLDNHRGWSEFLVNLALAVTTLGIGLLIKGVVNYATNRSFFFVHQTASAKLVDGIDSIIDEVPVPNL